MYNFDCLYTNRLITRFTRKQGMFGNRHTRPTYSSPSGQVVKTKTDMLKKNNISMHSFFHPERVGTDPEQELSLTVKDSFNICQNIISYYTKSKG